MKKTIKISRKQFEVIKNIFEKYDVNDVFYTETYDSGIGPSVMIEFTPNKITIDITDFQSW